MTAKPLVLRARAHGDVVAAIDYYRAEEAPAAALGFIDAMERAFAHIRRHPGAGSTRYAHELGLPGLRYRGLRRYPYAIFYVERADRIDIWRVLHTARDIPAWMTEDDR